MFRQTQFRLTVLNAVIFFVILTLFGTATYSYMKYRLIEKVDESLLAQAKGLRLVSINNSFKPMIQVRLDQALTDRRITLVLRDRQGQVVAQWDMKGRPLMGLVPTPTEENTLDLSKFWPDHASGTPRTVQTDGATYRVVTVPLPGGPVAAFKGTPVTVVQAICSIDPEISMLRSLFIIVLAGVLAGGLVTVLAGFFLASRALIPIRRAWEKQQQFVADASHELRTPLSVIKANTELLLRHPERTIEEESARISSVLQECNRMTKLVNTLLTLARADSNQLELHCAPLQLELLVRQAAEPFQALFEMKRIDLKLDLDERIEISGDEERLNQLLVILLDNALKYTPEHGLVTVKCRKYAHSAQLVVEDTGTGIAPHDLPYIFDRFYRGDKARSRSDGSAGLGLSIAKWIVEKHGGKIRADSKPSVGTQISVTLPRNELFALTRKACRTKNTNRGRKKFSPKKDAGKPLLWFWPRGSGKNTPEQKWDDKDVYEFPEVSGKNPAEPQKSGE